MFSLRVLSEILGRSAAFQLRKEEDLGTFRRADAESGLARALAADPRILLLDEPFSGLEERLRLKMGQLVKKIQKERKITTIFVTHDKREALQMSDKIALMAEGKILQYRTPENIFFQPVSRYAAEYFGKCNYLRGQVRNGRFEGSRLENRISQKVGSGDGHLQPSEDQGRESI